MSVPPTANPPPAVFTSCEALLGIIEAAPVAMLVADRNGIIVLANAEARRLLGYTDGELRGLAVASLLPEKYLQPLQAFLTRFWQKPEKRSIEGGAEFQVRSKAGREVWVQLGFNPVEIGGTVYALGAMLDITERKCVTDALQENRRMLATLLDNLPGMAYRCLNDEHWTMQFVSEGCFELTGYRCEDLIGNRAVSFEQLILPEDREQVRREVTKALRLGSRFELAYRIRAADGTIKWLSERGRGIFDERGPVVALEGFISDITARIRAEQERVESEQTMRAILDHSFEFIGLLDTEGRMLRANRTSLQATAVAWEEVKGRLFWETPWWTHSTVEQAKLRDAVGRAARGEFVRFETTHPGPGGRLLTIDFSLKPVRDEFGVVTALVPEGRDITERKLTEQALQESEEIFSKAFRASPDAISLSDLSTGQFIDVNEGYERLSGYSRAEIIGRTSRDIGIWSDPADREKLLVALQQRGSVRDMPVKARNRKGELTPFMLAAEIVEIRGRPCVVIVSRDMTAWFSAEQALRESEEKFSKAFRASPHWLAISEVATGRYLDVNSGFEKISGYSRAEVLGRTSLELGMWKDPADRDELLRMLQRDGFVRGWELQFRRRDGGLVSTLYSCEQIEIGGLSCLLNTIEDITDRRQAELALRESEEKFSKAFLASPHSLTISEVATGKYIDVNNGFERISGYTRAEVLGRTSFELGLWKNPGDRDDLVRMLQRDGFVRNWELQFRRRDGGLVSALCSCELIEVGGVACLLNTIEDITNRRQAEQAMRDSEEKFATAFRLSPDIMSLSDLETGCYTEVNSAHEKLFGFSREECIGHSPIELGLVEEDGEGAEMRRQLQETGVIRDMKVKAKARDGRELVLLMSAEIIQIGGRRSIVRASRDMTAMVQAEEAMRQSEEKFSKAFRASPDAIAITDLETGLYVDANGGHEHIFGYTREETIGRTTLELGYYQNPADRDRLVAEIRAHGTVRDLELACFSRNRRPITVLYSGESIEMDGRKFLVSVVRDITDRKRAEEALRDSEARFRNYFESPFIGMAITGTDTRWIEVNDHLCRMLGYTREELLQLRWNDVTVDEDLKESAALLKRALAGEIDGSTFEKRYRRKDGSILYVNISTRLFRRGDGTPDYFLTVIQDVTEQHETEAARARLEDQLRQAQKLEALGTLAGGIAHDFNNILTAIVVYRELAVMDIDRPDDLRKHLAEIGQASSRAKELVRQILTFSRQQKQERRTVRLHPVVREAFQLLRSSLPSTLEMSLQIDEQAPEVLADAGQIHQIVMNLATNSAHAMRDRPGQLTVQLAPQSVDEEFCRTHHGLRPGLYAHLAVADTGHGMDEATLAHIFEPFFTTKAPGEGTGLGLAVVHGIMEDHDGAIFVRSRLGEGTTFDLFFPQHAGSFEVPVELDAAIPRGRGESVLLIDDEMPVCEAICRMLQKIDYQVTSFTDSTEAVARFAAAPARFDIVLTDHTMPRLTGLDVIREVHARRPGIPILLLSGLSGTWTPEKLRGFDIREVIAKPLNFSSLAQSVRRALDQSRKTVR